MKKLKLFLTMILSVLLISSLACQDNNVESEGEEEGVQLKINETFDSVRKGVRLILSYDSPSSSFVGVMENITDETIKSVRVEVHLSNGVELGPTESIDLATGQKEDVKLEAKGQAFEWWSTHAESGEGEIGSDHEGEGEHSGEREGGEHSGKREKGEHGSKSEGREHN